MSKTKNIIFFFFLIVSQLNYSQNTDVDILKSIHNKSVTSWDQPMHLCSGSVYFIMPLSFVATIGHGYYKKDDKIIRNGLRSVASILMAGGITSVLKLSVNRPRPFVDYPAFFIQKDKSVGPHSFPSGHTTFAFATATNLSFSYKKWYVAVPAYAYASIVGYSRMHLGVHYPSDVLVGAVIGVGSGFLVWKLDEMLLKKKKKEKLKVEN